MLRRPRPGPRPRLNREQIVAAAVAIGVERVTIAGVAAELDAAPASLYRHVGSLADLVGAALESVFAAAPLPDPSRGWRRVLLDEAEIRFTLLTRYIGLLPEHGDGLAGVAAARFEHLVRELVRQGFGLDDAVLAVDSVLDVVHDGVHQIRGLRDPTGPVATALALHPPDLRSAVQRILDAPRDHLWRKIGLVLDGVERIAPPG